VVAGTRFLIELAKTESFGFTRAFFQKDDKATLRRLVEAAATLDGGPGVARQLEAAYLA
jgi:hypothetical protein